MANNNLKILNYLSHPENKKIIESFLELSVQDMV